MSPELCHPPMEAGLIHGADLYSYRLLLQSKIWDLSQKGDGCKHCFFPYRPNSLSITGNSATVVSFILGSTFCGLVACLQQELFSFFSFSSVFALGRDHFAQKFVFLEMNLFFVLH